MVAVASQRVVVCNNLKRTPNLASMSDELEKTMEELEAAETNEQAPQEGRKLKSC